MLKKKTGRNNESAGKKVKTCRKNKNNQLYIDKINLI